MTRRRPEIKVEIPIAKAEWHPCPLTGQIVLVSTRSNRGESHAASKSWLTLVASEPPMLGLCCKLSHRTAINILETREFVINIPGEDLVTRVWSAGDSVASEVETHEPAPWSFTAAERVGAPRVQECRAHIECVLDSTRRFNDEEMMFFGRIVSVSMDESLLTGTPEERYRSLKSLVYLEPGLFTAIDNPRKVPS
jgi:flavin reductase (DIM6/NTAB) family NADH-FMN oxidoreductase RutF